MKVSVLIPAYNEEELLGETLDSLGRALPGAELVVIDDGSQDGTELVARARQVVFARHVRNLGKAEALATGLGICAGEIIAMVDADMGPLAGEVLPLVDAVKRGECDMAIALFASSQGGGLGLVRNLARWGIFAFTGKRLQAPLSGQRAATRTLLEQCLPRGGGFGLETELTLRALRRGFAVREIPTDFVHRGDGWKLAGIRHRGRQFFHVLAALARGGFLWRRR
ncbi:MAG: glycosyltransferase family 2 protein [Bacillota bacterium]